MLNDLEQLLDSKTCLACEGCCRFNKERSEWRAMVAPSESEEISDHLSSVGHKFSHTVDDQGYLRDKRCHGLYACALFNDRDNTFSIYSNRPFQCRIYPFLLTKINGKPVISVHLACPFIQEYKGSDQYDEYVKYLKEYFKKEDARTLVNQNAGLFASYSGHEEEIEPVFTCDECWESQG